MTSCSFTYASVLIGAALLTFAPPHRAARAQGSARDADEAPPVEIDLPGGDQTVAIELSEFSHILLPVRIGGQNVRRMLDTNSAISWLGKGKAEQLGLASKPWRRISGPFGGMEMRLTDPLDWHIGSKVRARGNLVVIEVPEGLRDAIDGAVGLNFLAGKPFAIQWAERRLTFLTKPPAEPPDQFAAMKLERHRSSYSVPCQLEGFGSIRCLFDTATSGFAVRQHVWRWLGRSHKLGQFIYVGSSAIGGIGVSLEARCPPLTVGPFRCRQLLIQVGTARSLLPAREVDAVAGIDLWKRFDLVVDLANLTLWLRPSSAFDEPQAYNRSGLLCRPDAQRQRYVVWRIVEGSPADRAGIRQDDVLMAINAQPIDRSGMLPPLRALLAPAGTRVEMTFERDGKSFTKTLVLAELLAPPPTSRPAATTAAR